MPSVVRLEYIDSINVVFLDRTYRWLDAARFAVSGTPSGSLDVLRALLGHDQYTDHYTMAIDVAGRRDATAEPTGDHDDDQQPRRSSPSLHGPYFADFITPASFEHLDAPACLAAITRWLEEAGGDPDQLVPPADELRGDLTPLLATVETFADVYRLRQLPDEAVHEYGFVVQPYIEFVGLDADRRNLWLVAGGTD